MVAPKSLLASLMLWQACVAAPAGDTARAQSIEWRPYEPREITHGSWRIKSLLDDAGLSGRFVFFVDFDRHGNAWIASSEGLYSYDGYTWTRYSQRDGLPSNFVRSVRVAGDGTLWIGTNKGVATRDAQGRITVLKDAGPAGPNVRRIVEDPDGTLWFCSDTWLTPNASSGLASYRRGEWTIYRQEDGLPGNYVSDYFRDSAGRRFVLSSDGLAVNDGGGWSRPLEAGTLRGS